MNYHPPVIYKMLPWRNAEGLIFGLHRCAGSGGCWKIAFKFFNESEDTSVLVSACWYAWALMFKQDESSFKKYFNNREVLNALDWLCTIHLLKATFLSYHVSFVYSLVVFRFQIFALRQIEPSKFQKYVTNFIRGISLVMIPVAATVPSVSDPPPHRSVTISSICLQ